MVSEEIAFVVILCAALAPLLMACTRNRLPPPTAQVATVGLWVGMPLAILMLAGSGREPVWSRPQPTDRPLEQPGDGYVGSESCRTCHADKHASWYTSYHRTMTQQATSAAVIGDFSGVELKDGTGWYRLSGSSNEFWVEMPDPDWLEQTQAAELAKRVQAGALSPTLKQEWDEVQKGKKPSYALFEALQEIVPSIEVPEQWPRAWRPIVLTTGSHHMQAYWYGQGSREVALLPFVFLAAEQRWIRRSAALLGPHEKSFALESGGWNVTCIKCHSTHGQPRVAPEGVATRVAEFGIACEACHGPGQRHVEANRDPLRRYNSYLSDQGDPTIVQPQRLSHRLSSHVCGQCHSIVSGYWNLPREQEFWSGSPFRPGDDLEQVARLVRGRQPDAGEARHESDHAVADEGGIQFWSDGMVRVSGREYNGLIETPCFQRGELSCLSCHQMHQSAQDLRSTKEWADDQLKPGMRGNLACVQCHREYEREEVLTQHTHHAAGSSGGVCYNCHMPYTTYGLLKAIRSHQIDSPSVAASLSTGRPNACNQCHLDQTLEWTSQHLERWYQIPPPTCSEEDRQTSAAVRWLLRGDAGQRALMAWSMGWDEAHEASGNDWQAPFVAQLLEDPYDAVRLIAARTLRRLPYFGDVDVDLLPSPEQGAAARQRVWDKWERLQQQNALRRTGRPAILIDESGGLLRTELQRLLQQRDNREIRLLE